jgi:hypothetical protein
VYGLCWAGANFKADQTSKQNPILWLVMEQSCEVNRGEGITKGSKVGVGWKNPEDELCI